MDVFRVHKCLVEILDFAVLVPFLESTSRFKSSCSEVESGRDVFLGVFLRLDGPVKAMFNICARTPCITYAVSEHEMKTSTCLKTECETSYLLKRKKAQTTNSEPTSP